MKRRRLMGNETAKMLLRGASPWGEIIERLPDGSARLRIDNTLWNEMDQSERKKIGAPDMRMSHGYKENDIVTCRLHPEYNKWVPVADWLGI
jgi:hypothetical protein